MSPQAATAPARDPGTRPLYVAAVGDAGDPLTWSGIPFHLTETGRAAGFVTAGLPLGAEGRLWRARRIAWNLGRLGSGDRRGGFQYSPMFLERLWQAAKTDLSGARVLNCFQLFAPSMVDNESIEKWFFIDLTLTQLFDYYRLRAQVGRRIAADAVAREREGYQRAAGIVVMSHFAAQSVHRDYGVPQERIHVVVPGANLDPEMYRRWEASAGAARAVAHEALRLVIVSTDWKRKGLDRLLRALALARRDGLRATLRVVGNTPQDLPPELAAQPGVEWLGRINKSTDAARFLDAVADADVGCILARYEAGGSVLREYHALGLAALATDAGGMPDFMFPEASVTVPAEASDQEIAERLVALGNEPERLERLRKAAWERRHEATWEHTVRRLRDIVDRPD